MQFLSSNGPLCPVLVLRSLVNINHSRFSILSDTRPPKEEGRSQDSQLKRVPSTEPKMNLQSSSTPHRELCLILWIKATSRSLSWAYFSFPKSPLTPNTAGPNFRRLSKYGPHKTLSAKLNSSSSTSEKIISHNSYGETSGYHVTVHLRNQHFTWSWKMIKKKKSVDEKSQNTAS